MDTATKQTLPATDALTLVCSALANTERYGPDGVLMSSSPQSVTFWWTGLGAHDHHVELLDRDIVVPAQWTVTGHVEVFAIGSVR